MTKVGGGTTAQLGERSYYLCLDQLKFVHFLVLYIYIFNIQD